MNRNGPTTGCTACNDSSAPRLLHNVRHRGVYHRLCASCVLKFHPASFCPTCLDVFDSSPPSGSVRCSKCTSISHSACVPTEAPDSSYVCPSCSNPSSTFFKIGASGAADGGPAIGRLSIDLKSSQVLLAAARIAAASMCRAVAVARMDVERKVREAAVARKRAREALERAALIASKEKEKRLKGISAPVPAVEQKKKSKSNSAVAAAVAAQKRIQSNKSGGFSASLNNVGSVGKEKLVGFHTPIAVQRPSTNGLSLEEKDNLKGPPALASGHQQLHNHVLKEEKMKNQGFSGPSTSRQLHSGSSHVTEEEGKLKRFTNSEMGPPQLPQSNQAIAAGLIWN
ncbi:uncharacterized protein LOC131230402 isoform X2 [Magnolia sinica]|uniref:uncharacterized protein LOC131230402 isoform X2 n=1 Tax=Magnolia sinica TaxID=86752 RepID=UPI0026596F7B|nr:uncharacterized protein LOC131230402 isoform X2 [Magnolia sinica]